MSNNGQASSVIGQITLTLMLNGQVQTRLQLQDYRHGRVMLNAARDFLEDQVIQSLNHKDPVIEVPDEETKNHLLRPPPENAN